MTFNDFFLQSVQHMVLSIQRHSIQIGKTPQKQLTQGEKKGIRATEEG